jgi:hypothetical protein
MHPKPYQPRRMRSLRPGAHDHEQPPSRIGEVLRYGDGTQVPVPSQQAQESTAPAPTAQMTLREALTHQTTEVL